MCLFNYKILQLQVIACLVWRFALFHVQVAWRHINMFTVLSGVLMKFWFNKYQCWPMLSQDWTLAPLVFDFDSAAALCHHFISSVSAIYSKHSQFPASVCVFACGVWRTGLRSSRSTDSLALVDTGATMISTSSSTSSNSRPIPDTTPHGATTHTHQAPTPTTTRTTTTRSTPSHR